MSPRPDSSPHGFTLIELVIVMAIIAMLLTLAVPRYFTSLDHGKIKVQQQNIASLRDAIDKYYGDQGRYPDSLQDLVNKRYLRSLPADPATEQANWIVVPPPANSGDGNVYDVRSALPLSADVANGGNNGASASTTNSNTSAAGNDAKK